MTYYIVGILGAMSIIPYLIHRVGVISVKYQLKQNIYELEHLRHFTMEPIDEILKEHMDALSRIKEWEKESVFKNHKK